jgi:hypothetical protein
VATDNGDQCCFREIGLTDPNSLKPDLQQQVLLWKGTGRKQTNLPYVHGEASLHPFRSVCVAREHWVAVPAALLHRSVQRT